MNDWVCDWFGEVKWIIVDCGVVYCIVFVVDGGICEYIVLFLR